MDKSEYEQRIDSVDRTDIYYKAQTEWLESFKTDDVPIEKRIKDYQINSYGVSTSNSKEIVANFSFSVTPVDPENTEWEIGNGKRNFGFLEMTNVDGEYKVDYLSTVPRDYDKFLEEFENWKEENKEIKVITTQGEKEVINSNEQIDKMSNGITIFCVLIITIIVFSIILKIFRKKQ